MQCNENAMQYKYIVFAMLHLMPYNTTTVYSPSNCKLFVLNDDCCEWL